MELKLLMLFLYIFSSRAINRCQRQQILPLKEVCNLISFRKYRMSRLFAKEKSARKASPEKAALMEEVENVLLPKLFGHPKFRPGQREIISKILAGESCLAILPTGAGKSLLYMLPSQLLDGITLVVSPLLALMRDQVEALRKEGINAMRLDSSMTMEEIKLATSEIVSGRVKVLYITPERFNNEKFRRMIGSLRVAMFVVDEAHCISEWGHAFRPDYLRLSDFATASNAQVRLALTATATKRVAQDIMERLDIKARNTVRLPSSRKNLILSVAYFPYPDDGYSEKLKALLESLPLLAKGGSVIIYVSKRQLAVTLANDLLRNGYNAKAYHSAIDDREEVENWFLRTKDSPEKEISPIVVGTTAFGMGIDKSDVRSVVHFDLSRSVEDYVQGIGRAGRDGLEASCLAFLADTDRPALISQYMGQSPSLEIFQKIARKIFNVESFPAKYDSALYLSEYDIANEFDVDNLRITLGLAHLVQKGIMTPLTQVYSAYKVGKIDEDAFSDFTRKLKSNSETNFLFEDEEYTSEDLVDINKKALDMVMIIADHIRSTAKRKWTTIDTISLSNRCACPPATIASFVGLLTYNKICVSGGVSKIYNRYKLAKGNVRNGKISEDEIYKIAEILYDHSVEIERRGIVRINEMVSLLEEGCQGGSDMWDSIALYFQENERGREVLHVKGKDDSKGKRRDEVPPYQLIQDDEKWGKIEELVHGGQLPNDDPSLIARFATGVYSPRMTRLSLTKHVLYGSMNHCNWDYVYAKARDVSKKN